MINDKTKLVKEAKTTKQVVVVGPPIKKRLGKMGLGEMLTNQLEVLSLNLRVLQYPSSMLDPPPPTLCDIIVTTARVVGEVLCGLELVFKQLGNLGVELASQRISVLLPRVVLDAQSSETPPTAAVLLCKVLVCELSIGHKLTNVRLHRFGRRVLVDYTRQYTCNFDQINGNRKKDK